MNEIIGSKIADLVVAVTEEEVERAKADGYSWDYCGAEYIRNRQRAERELVDAINDLIDSRVTLHLEAFVNGMKEVCND